MPEKSCVLSYTGSIQDIQGKPTPPICDATGLVWEEGQWEGSWAAIKRVWASKWNERAVLSLRRAGLSHGALQMAVLCQAVVPARYAFVAHTTNPMTGRARQPAGGVAQ